METSRLHLKYNCKKERYEMRSNVLFVIKQYIKAYIRKGDMVVKKKRFIKNYNDNYYYIKYIYTNNIC